MSKKKKKILSKFIYMIMVKTQTLNEIYLEIVEQRPFKNTFQKVVREF